ncbi:MAG: 2-haloacid dehalogenase [Rhodobacteraceae bacterium HLUCCA12]|nr:MAG: 2-haloacid dehalogenase [Rhodobacteraceae bacterium HLUCCA12]
MTHVVFDIGNVLVRWDPLAAFADMPRTAVEEMFDAIDFPAWNLANDGGRSRTDAIAAIARTHPQHAARMEEYFDRFHLTIQEPIHGTWQIADRLKQDGRRLFGLTNFSAASWPVALDLHRGLTDLFEDVVVSGVERALKPKPRIYAILCERNGLAPGDCLFIDDRADNVAGARAVGWDAVRFTTPDALERALAERGLL